MKPPPVTRDTMEADGPDNHGLRRGAVACACCLLLVVGCIPVPRGHNPLNLRFMSSDELRAYAEQVFRHHNRIMTRLMMAPIDEDSLSSAQRERLEDAETRMSEACSSLNEIASDRASGEDSASGLENRVRRNVRQCAKNTRRVEKILDRLEIDTPDQSAPKNSEKTAPSNGAGEY